MNNWEYSTFSLDSFILKFVNNRRQIDSNNLQSLCIFIRFATYGCDYNPTVPSRAVGVINYWVINLSFPTEWQTSWGHSCFRMLSYTQHEDKLFVVQPAYTGSLMLFTSEVLKGFHLIMKKVQLHSDFKFCQFSSVLHSSLWHFWAAH